MILCELYKVLPKSITIKIYCADLSEMYTGYSKDIPEELMDKQVFLVMPRYDNSLSISVF